MSMPGGEGGGSDGVNPNIDVGSEGEASTSAGGDIGFDDIEIADKPAKKEKSEEKKPVESKVKDENKGAKKEDDEGGGAQKKPTEKKPGIEAKPPGEKEDPAKLGRAKTFKGKHGETEVAISGATKFTVPSQDGKTTEDMTLQEIMNEVHGKKYWERTTKRVEAEDRARKKEAEAFDSTIRGFMETAQKDSDAGWDFLAELSKADPVKFKMDLLKKQIHEILPLARMGEDELQAWLADKEREYKDKSLQRRAKNLDEGDAKKKSVAEEGEQAKKYGIENDEWSALAERVAEHKRKKGDNSPVTPHNIVVASRLIMANEVIDEVVPHLAQHEKYDTIFDDIVSDLLRHPGLTRERLKATLKETFGASDDNRSSPDLKATAEQIQRHARASGQSTQNKSSKTTTDHESFEDL